MSYPSLLPAILAVLGLIAACCAFVLARRAARHQHRQIVLATAADAERSLASFQAAIAELGVSDRVARVVYEYFATRETPLDPGGRRPRSTDSLLEDHFISYPEDREDTLGSLQVQLGLGPHVPQGAAEEVRTIADAAVWLERRLTDRGRHA